MKYFILFLLSFFLIACGGSAGGGGGAADLSGFESTNIPGSDMVKVERKDQSGKILEEGFVINGVRNGAWIVYHPDSDRIKSITHYANGKVNGYHIELSNRGQIEFKGSYLDDKYNGPVSKYKFGRPLEEYIYSKGELNGKFTIYSDRGKVQRKGAYKDGKQDGLLQYFDDEGNATLEYEYKNGEKLSGGIIESKTTEE